MKYTVIDSLHNEITLDINDIINLIKQNPTKIYYKLIDNNKVMICNDIATKTTFICHRINNTEDLKNINPMFGTEVDIRDDHISQKLILAHNPFDCGELFEDYLEKYHHNTLILNIKSERIESRCLELLDRYKITNYFFLDSSFPMIHLINKEFKISNFASRYSEYEPIESTISINNFIEWIWIDCFNYMPTFFETDKKICIVSPELHNQKKKIQMYRQQLIDSNTVPDAICCKYDNIIEWI